ncbi:ChrR family anti-sigma-E factor [Thalassomonas sp. M1454]|uniref:ChrR family anti-sigma-E factor n=1 Tax=Thalassomonas sp. M1454 TaxID=2594477 RepID=UPI001181607A|nr:ChrR family anti-sigma-E factor [Thalassomonas sp. M1454]TRX54997.1 transcriptional regulator [Thalassomonas sp. M1454]
MIKHHPKTELLNAHVNGQLPASLSAAIAMHNDLCPQCAQAVKHMTEQQAELLFEHNDAPELANDIDLNEIDIEQMISDITNDDSVELLAENVPVTISVKGQDYKIPRAIQHMHMGKWHSLGKITRARMELNEGDIHSSLLQIEPGGTVPEHTHKGFELTLLLQGSFSDEMGTYVPGDFIMLDGEHQHTPATTEGCLCFTVADGAQHFTQGINKLLNPIGSFIY